MDPRERHSVLQDLESHDEDVRRLAVERLVVLPPAEALPILVERLGDPEWRVRKAAVERLASSPDTSSVISVLIESLSDGENPGRRNAAVDALIGCGATAVPALLEATHSSDVDVRKLAADVLAGIGDERSAIRLISMLDDPDPNARGAAAEALGAMGYAGAAARLLRVATESNQDALVRLSCLRALSDLDAAANLTQLESVLAEPLLRPAAFELLGGCDDDEAHSVLIKGLTASSRSSREAAMHALLQTAARVDGPRAERLALRVREALRSSPDVISDACERLQEVPLATKLVLAQFLGMVGDVRCVVPLLEAGRDDALAGVALGALSAMGSSVEAPLVEAFAACSVPARRLACAVFARTRGSRALECLEAALDDADVEVRVAAAAGLGESETAEALESLLRRLTGLAAEPSWEIDDELEGLGAAIAWLVCRLRAEDEAHATGTVARLCERLGVASDTERVQIVRILGRIASSDAREPVTLLLSDPSAAVRRAAVESLACVDPTSDALRLALADESPLVRIAAARCLKSFDASLVMEDLSCLSRDEDARVRAARVHVLSHFAGTASGTPEGERLLEQLAEALSDQGPVAIAALEGLCDVGTRQAARAALKGLAREDPEILQSVIRCVGEHGDPDALESLLPLVRHSHWAVRAEAIEALARRGFARAIPAILRHLEAEEDGFVRDVILRALRRLEA